MGNILLIGTAAFVVIMTLIGMKRGLVKTVFSFGTLLLVVIISNLISAPVQSLLKDSDMYDRIEDSVTEMVYEKSEALSESITLTSESGQKELIESLPFPDSVKEDLIENNNQEGYSLKVVDNFNDYIIASVTEMIFNAVSFVLVFIVVGILVKVLIHVLELVTKLPVIHTFNTIGGGIVGLIFAVLIIWIVCIVVTMFSSQEWGQLVIQGIADNEILTFIYGINPVQALLENLL